MNSSITNQLAKPVIITRQAHWDKVAETLKRLPAIALDLEGHGFHHYPERICLFQIGLPDRVFLLDPLMVQDLTALGSMLANPRVEKIFHSCDFDLRSLDRDYGFRVRNIFDTAMAAHFSGSHRLGLANILQCYMGVELQKKTSLQRQDWSIRPLSSEAVNYAIKDVLYLPKLRKILAERLENSGRWSWIQEECRRLEDIKYIPPLPPQELFWNIKGSRQLTPRQRSVLKEINIFREKLARDFNRPPFKVISNETLLTLACKPSMDLSAVKGLRFVFQNRINWKLAEALNKGICSGGIPLPTSRKAPPPKPTEAEKKRLASLKAWRQSKGHKLGIDPALIWPLSSLEELALHPEEFSSGFKDRAGKDLREWQKREFSQELRLVLNAGGELCSD